jgi:uncharacterized protein with PIN domain
VDPPAISVRFYAELNDHLPAQQRYRTLEKSVWTATTAKDLIESFGVPHTEVDLILVNSEPAGLGQMVHPGDRVSVYPVFESFDIAPAARVRPQPLREIRFVLDVHLGKLAVYLRMLGFDAKYQSCFTDEQLAKLSAAERRILLTRDRGLLKRSMVTHGIWLRETDSRRQVAEVLERCDLARSMRPFTRCMACNAVLEEAAREAVLAAAPARVAELHTDFRKCPNCGRVYWKGSHYRRMESWIRELEADHPLVR